MHNNESNVGLQTGKKSEWCNATHNSWHHSCLSYKYEVHAKGLVFFHLPNYEHEQL